MASSHIRGKAYSDQQLSGFKDLFQNMKTYKDGTIHNSEYMDYLNRIGLPTTPAQLEVYKSMFLTQRGDDRIPLPDVMDFLRNLHDPAKLILVIAKSFDNDKDGIISQEEFQLGMDVLVSFDPETFGDKVKISFAQLLEEADTNKDGKIQIEELADWLSKISTSHIISEPYTAQELSRLREVFKSMKTYKDGHFHSSEYADFCNAVGIPTTPEQGVGYQKFWNALRGDDLVPLEETVSIFASLHDPIIYSMQVAQLFDKDKDGIITKEEFEAGMKGMATFDPARFGEKGNTSFEQFMAEADTNQDGIIQMEELATWLGGQEASRIRDRAFTTEELDNFRNLFQSMKTYENGSIHNSELRLFQNLAGVPTTEAQVKLYSQYYRDLTGGDRVPIDNIMGIFGSLHDPNKLVVELCHQFDRNKDGIINKAEFEIGIKCLVAFDPLTFGEKGKIGFEQMLDEADTNKDGKIQIEEMANWLSKGIKC